MVAPALVALFLLAGAPQSPQPAPVVVAGVVVALSVAVVLAARSVTGWPLALGCLVAAVGVTLVSHAHASSLGWFTMCVLGGWCALAAPRAAALALGSVLVLGFVVQWLVDTDESSWGTWIAGTVFTTLACVVARRERLLLEQLREAQAGLADRARAEERNRIAAEMHDVIGHALTVSLLHVSSARLAMDDDPEEARASLEEAERLARRSLEEVRATVGLMRSTSDAAPLPGAGDLDELVESFRRAGTDVTLQVEGDPATWTSTSALAVYRIVQESLTNVARHAPGSRTCVGVRVDTGGTRVTVDSDGPPARRTPADGVGLLGMRERAEAVGGRLTAGPWGTGWRVEAVLPR